VTAIKQQAEATNTEYDRLLKEYETLQNKLKELEGSKGCKKEE
jgi:uncharacterized protein YdcH (DUF465 family)